MIIFKCTYNAGGTCLIEVDVESKLVWISRNGGYRHRLADMPIDSDCLRPSFDGVGCWNNGKQVNPVQSWETCIDLICPDPEAYREYRNREHQTFLHLSEIQLAFGLADTDMPVEAIRDLLTSTQTTYHPMMGRNNLKEQERNNARN